VPKKSAGQRSDLNQAWLDEISLTEKLAVAAAKTDCAVTLAKRKIDAPWLASLSADLDRARTLAGQATGKTTGKRVATKEEQGLRDALIGQIQSVQSAAKQKYFATNKAALADYYYGQNTQGMSRAALEACATSILAKARDAGLPGIEADELQALDDALAAYRGVETEQSGEQSGATGTRKQLDQLIKAIAEQRRELQFAADGLWPAAKKENAGIRREFGLQPDKAFKG
jgi:molybdenum-dependent DNA-binding transcriptional regulator ModE